MTTQQELNAQKVLTAIRNAGGQITASGLMKLIAVTNKVRNATIVQLHNYVSDESENTELSDYTINIGTNYGSAKESTQNRLDNLTKEDIVFIGSLCTPKSIKGFNYINRKNLTENEYCKEVVLAIPEAITDMRVVKPRNTSHVIYLNKVLSFNTNTSNLLISGELIKGGKKVKVESTNIKMVAKAPKTVAKEVIKGYLNARTNKIRSFSITHLNTISVSKEKITLVEV